MAIFRPPTDNFAVGYVNWNMPMTPEARLISRLTPVARGRNVYLLTDGTYTENQPAYWTDVEKVYWGGHENEVTAAEVTSLTTAGYGAYIEA